MLKLILLFLIIGLLSCGGNNNPSLTNTEDLISSLNPEGNYLGCSVESQNDGKVKIICADGTEAFLENGADGADGVGCEVSEQVGGVLLQCANSTAFIKHGVDGADGSACSVEKDSNNGGALIKCSDGTMAFIRDGVDGKTCELSPNPQGVVMTCGDQSQLIQNGAQGESCLVYQESNGATIKCGQATAFVANGDTGAGCDVTAHPDGALVTCGVSSVVVNNGEDGLDSVVEVINPCGPSGGYDEVLLVLQSGEIIAYFESGGKRFLTELKRNQNYQTTDGTKCKFRVNEDGTVTDL